MGNWTVILHTGRGKATIYNGLSAEAAQRMIDIAVFKNRDCTNFSCFEAEL